MTPTEKLRRLGKEKGFWNEGYDAAHFCRQLYRDFDFRHKNVLEIGCGRGVPALWAVANGAARVVGLEPLGDGADISSPCFTDFASIASALGLANAKILPITFQEYDAEPEGFDLVLSVASINHLDEASCINLNNRPECVDSYRQIFNKMYSIMRPGAKLIIVDAGRRNLFCDLGVVNPITPSIEWHKHQEPEVWAGLLEECGFTSGEIRWLSGRLLRYFGVNAIPRPLSYALQSVFRLEMARRKSVEVGIGV